MNRFQQRLESKQTNSDQSEIEDPYAKLKQCKEKLRVISDILKDLSNKL